MAFNIKDPETDQLARALAAATGESLTDAVRAALRDRLERQTRRGKGGVAAEIRRIQERLARLPVLDKRSPEKIIDYDKHGLPRTLRVPRHGLLVVNAGRRPRRPTTAGDTRTR